MKKRLFVAIPLSGYFRKIFAGYQRDYNTEGIRWTIPENLHITVYFLGNVQERTVPRVMKALEGVLSQIPPLDFEFDKISLAPPGRPARMVWAIFQDTGGAYKALVDKVYAALEEFATRDNRSKESIPHITLARFKYPSIGKEIKITQPDVEDKVMKISSCDLMESELSRSGPTYSVIETFNLGTK